MYLIQWFKFELISILLFIFAYIVIERIKIKFLIDIENFGYILNFL
jgi:hypothetical protein